MKIATIKGPLGVGVDSFRMVSSMRIARANPPFFNEKKPINMGDWFMTNTIDRILNWKDLLIIYLNQENIDWNYINKECDAVILRGGNYINGGWLSRVYSKKMLSKIKIPIILFGAGLQSSIHGKVELTKEDIDILKFISGSCNSFSVRGEDTAKVLRDIGIENSVVTGCPTLFRSLKPRIKIRNPTNERALFSFRQGLYTHDFGPYKKQLQAIRILRKKFKSIRVVLQGEETALQNYFQYKHWGSRYHDKLIPIPGTNIKKLEREYMDINKIKKDIHLLFDCLRAPYDVAHILQVTLAVGNCDLYVSGNSIDLKHKKIISKINSWGIYSYPNMEIFEDLYFASQELHNRGRYLIGTSPHAKKSIFDLDLSDGKSVFIFGTESSGLSKEKISKLDELVSVPTTEEVPFLTLPTVVPIIAYEYYRQLGGRK